MDDGEADLTGVERLVSELLELRDRTGPTCELGSKLVRGADHHGALALALTEAIATSEIRGLKGRCPLGPIGLRERCGQRSIRFPGYRHRKPVITATIRPRKL